MNNWIERIVPVKSFLRLDEVADLLGVHQNTVRNWISEEKIESIRQPTGEIRIPRLAIIKLLGAYAPGGRRTRHVIHPGIKVTHVRR